MARCGSAPRSTGGSRARGGRRGRDLELSPRARVLAALLLIEEVSAAQISRDWDGDRFRPGSSARSSGALPKRSRARSSPIAPCRPQSRGNYPDWLEPAFEPSRSAATLRARWRRCSNAAPLDLRVNSLKAEREAVRAALMREGVGRGAHATLALGLAPLRARAVGTARHVPRRASRGAGRRLAARGAPRRCAARHARRRFLRRRRRQDAGAGGEHGQSRPSHRLRHLAPAGSSARPSALRRAGSSIVQREAAYVGARSVGEASRRELRPRAGRRALHRHRHLAAQSRCEMAPQALGPRRADRAPGRHPRQRPPPRAAGRAARLCDLLALARRGRGAGRALPRRARRLRARPHRRASGARRWGRLSRPRRDAAPVAGARTAPTDSSSP